MSSKFNTPREMMERTAYAIHIAILVAASFTGFIAIVSAGLWEAFAASLLLIIFVVVRMVGMRSLDFKRIERELKYYQPNAQSPWLNERIAELFELFERLENQPMNWRDRHQLRGRIVGILRQDERLSQYYWKRIKSRHPYLLNAL